MTCGRCHGLMVERPCCAHDWWQVSSRWPKDFYVFACVNCGNYEDRTICFNRSKPIEAMASRRHHAHWTRIKAAVRSMQEVA